MYTYMILSRVQMIQSCIYIDMQKRFHLDLRGGPLEKAKIKIGQGKQKKKIRAVTSQQGKL